MLNTPSIRPYGVVAMKHYESYFHETLSDDDYRAVGRVLVTFAQLEHALVRAGIVLSGALGANEATTRIAVAKGVEQTFKGRYKYFSDAYRKAVGDDEWINSLEESMSYATRIRDHFVHGQWDKLSDGRLTVEFFARQAIREGAPSYVMDMTSSDLDKLSESNKRNVKLLNDRFPAVSKWPPKGTS